MQFQCTQCGNIIQVPANVAGRKVRCKQCREVVRAPAGLPPRKEVFDNPPQRSSSSKRTSHPRSRSARSIDQESQYSTLASSTLFTVILLGLSTLLLWQFLSPPLAILLSLGLTTVLVRHYTPRPKADRNRSSKGPSLLIFVIFFLFMAGRITIRTMKEMAAEQKFHEEIRQERQVELDKEMQKIYEEANKKIRAADEKYKQEMRELDEREKEHLRKHREELKESRTTFGEELLKNNAKIENYYLEEEMQYQQDLREYEKKRKESIPKRNKQETKPFDPNTSELF